MENSEKQNRLPRRNFLKHGSNAVVGAATLAAIGAPFSMRENR